MNSSLDQFGTGEHGSDRYLSLKFGTQPFVSVIVPVRNDNVRLEQCLRALESKTYPRDRYEVVVVDNGSTQSVAPVVASYSHARLMHEGRPGSYAVRNAGLLHARGEVVAFTGLDEGQGRGVRSMSKANRVATIIYRCRTFSCSMLPRAGQLHSLARVTLSQHQSHMRICVVTRPAYASALGQAGQRRIREHFSSTRSVERMWEIIKGSCARVSD